MPTLYCPKCGYNLTGLTENRCPECGAGFDELQIERVRFNAERFAVIAIFQVVLVPAGLAVLFPVFLFVGTSIFGGVYTDSKFVWFAILVAACLAMSHGIILGRGYHRSKVVRFGAERHGRWIKTAVGYGLLFTSLEIVLVATYVVSGAILISM